nr:type II toxin-antitoxin system RelE/ParE family toxin [Pelovirga terrestris]
MAPQVADDLDRIVHHLTSHAAHSVNEQLQSIMAAMSLLEHSPLIGRPAATDMRELVIGRRSRGYVALYRYVAEIDTVFVLALKSQCEAGYA